MEWVDNLQGELVGLDTAPLIYFIEEHPTYLESVTEQAARLRAEHNIRTPDAIQLASVTQEGASFFVTNDSRLPELPSLNLLILDDLQ